MLPSYYAVSEGANYPPHMTCCHFLIFVQERLSRNKQHFLKSGAHEQLRAALPCSLQGKKISFYKRAQILVADFWGVMEARGEGDIVSMDWLTMFADYRVPQALVYLGALRYSDALMQALKNGETGARVHVFLWSLRN